jgi:hypothetical protein
MTEAERTPVLNRAWSKEDSHEKVKKPLARNCTCLRDVFAWYVCSRGCVYTYVYKVAAIVCMLCFRICFKQNMFYMMRLWFV